MEKTALNTLRMCQVTDHSVLMHLSHLLVLLKVFKHTATKESTWIATPLGHSLWAHLQLCAQVTDYFAKTCHDLFLQEPLLLSNWVCLVNWWPFDSFAPSYLASVTLDFTLSKFYLIFWDILIKKTSRPWMALIIDKLFFWMKSWMNSKVTHCHLFPFHFLLSFLKRKVSLCKARQRKKQVSFPMAVLFCIY